MDEGEQFDWCMTINENVAPLLLIDGATGS